MAESLKRQILVERLLAALEQHDDLGAFLGEILDDVAEFLEARGAAVLRINPPQWEAVGKTGVGVRDMPIEAAAAALDAGRLVTRDAWRAVPLTATHVFCARGVGDAAEMERLTPPLAAASRIVLAGTRRALRIQRLERMLAITQIWRQKCRLETLLHAMAEAATDLLQADRASIFLWDRARGQLVGRPALGVADGELRIPDDTGIVGQVLQTGEPRRVGGGVGEDQISRQVDARTGYRTRNLLCVPLTTPAGRRLGAFEVLNKVDGHFTDDDQQGLEELAAHAAVALESTQEFEDLVSKHQRLVDQAAEGVQLVGRSPAIEALRSTLGRVANTDLALLILGENGVGKEVAARSIHYLSRRRDQPFIAVNCAAIPETLLESELFGHEKGAFTDAREARRGKFELASGGTLLLDEIGDLSLAGQAKLLRVLEDKIVTRVGGSLPIATDVRILAATNHDLAAMVRARRFREDLYFRLNVISIELPPLRERGDDVLLLAEHFLAGFCRAMGRRPPRFSPAARQRLLAHRWPGNVRELRNLSERLAYLTTSDLIEPADLAFVGGAAAESVTEPALGEELTEATRQFQQRYIQQTIDGAQGNMSLAARRLGLHRSNLYRKMRQLGLPATEA